MKRFALLLVAACGCSPALSSGDNTLLSEMGLYADMETKEVAAGVDEFQVRFPLWTDGAKKHRWMKLPEDQPTIDISDPNAWSFPVGTRFYKEFAKDGARIETRVISREGEDEWFFGAYLWRADQSDADLVLEGMRNANGHGYEVPSQQTCVTCHQSQPSHILGFSAVQMKDVPVEQAMSPALDPAVAAGFSYLHANCGHCHNPDGFAYKYNDMILRMDIRDGQIDLSSVYQSTVGRPAASGLSRIEPGNPAASAIIDRMTRPDNTRMPPIGTHELDGEGVRIVTQMIEALR